MMDFNHGARRVCDGCPRWVHTKYGLEYLLKTTSFEIVEIKALSGFWLTFGSEFNYYISDISRGPLRYISKIIIVVNNIVFRFLNKTDQKIHHGTDKWTWMYLVVARKPR